MKPLLSAVYDPNNTSTTWPKFVSPKLDGIRALVIDGVVVSRSLKPIPNPTVQERFGHERFNGLDGELIVGLPTDPDCYNNTQAVMRKIGFVDAKFHVFDDFTFPEMQFRHRLDRVRTWMDASNEEHVTVVPHSFLANAQITQWKYETYLEQGFEGIMLRDPDGVYKFGRSTEREQILLKYKPLVDSDAIVLGVFEQMHNTNEATTNALGRTERSSHAEGLVGKGTTGGFVARDIHSGIEFNVGIFKGATDEDRKEWWRAKSEIVGKCFKYKSLSIGVKEKPRHPRWIGWRSELDLSS
jgi:DNA ligase-1